MKMDRDLYYLHKALLLAKKGIYSVNPNPAVGAIVVKDKKIVGMGYHKSPGSAHAEQIALKKAGYNSAGATLYVNLEPCCHHGKTPPCLDLIIEKKIKRVVICQKDPNPLVNGKSIKLLKKNGIDVKLGLLENEAISLNKKFNHYHLTNRPYILAKTGMSLDGKIADYRWNSKWITSSASRNDVQKERAMSSSILSTSSTIIKDDPRLNIRKKEYLSKLKTQPPLLILDNKLKIPLTSKVFEDTSRKIYIFSSINTNKKYKSNVLLVKTPSNNQKLSLEFIIKYVAKQNINNIFIESGPNLLSSLITDNLVDEFLFYIAPKILGNNSKSFNSITYINKLSQKIDYHINYAEQINNDLKMSLTK